MAKNRSPGPQPIVRRNAPSKLESPPCRTITPFGVPVEPDV